MILNKKVLVPIFSTSWDDTALAVYQRPCRATKSSASPVRGLSDDAVHCRAIGIADDKMLYVRHVPLQTTSDTLNDYLVGAHIYAHSKGNLIADSLKIYYSVEEVGFFSSAPLLATADPDSFSGYIPHQRYGTRIRYFLKAGDDSGKVLTHPIIGEAWAHQFRVNMPPQITSTDSMLVRAPLTFGFYPSFIDIDDTSHAISYAFKPAWLSVSHDSLVGSMPVPPVVDSFKVVVADAFSSDALTVVMTSYFCGDPDRNGSVDISDVVMLIGYIFRGACS